VTCYFSMSRGMNHSMFDGDPNSFSLSLSLSLSSKTVCYIPNTMPGRGRNQEG